jgi:hypothetical protein
MLRQQRWGCSLEAEAYPGVDGEDYALAGPDYLRKIAVGVVLEISGEVLVYCRHVGGCLLQQMT